MSDIQRVTAPTMSVIQFLPEGCKKSLLFGVDGSRCCWGCCSLMLEVIKREVGGWEEEEDEEEEVFLISQTTVAVRPGVTDGD